MRCSTIIGLFVMLSLAAVSRGAVVTSTYTVGAGGFIDHNPNTDPPYSTVTVTATVTYDPTQSYSEATSIVLNSSTPTIFATLTPGFNYDPSTDTLRFGGLISGAQVVANGTNDFSASFSNASGVAPTFISFFYTLDTYGDIAETTLGGVVKTPEPASLGILSFALLLMRRRTDH